MSYNEWYNKWQRMTTSDNKWQRVTANDIEWETEVVTRKCSVNKMLLKPVALFSSDSNASVFQWILRNFKNVYFVKYQRTAASGEQVEENDFRLQNEWQRVKASDTINENEWYNERQWMATSGGTTDSGWEPVGARSSRPEVLFKKSVPKNFAQFLEKYHFLIKLQFWRPTTLLESYSITGAFLWPLRSF